VLTAHCLRDLRGSKETAPPRLALEYISANCEEVAG